MRRSLKKACFSMIFTALAGSLLASSSAELSLYTPAAIAFSQLGVPSGVRAIGMGEAYTAGGDDIAALYYNPAGLARVTGFQAALAHNEFASSLGLRQERISYGQGVGASGGFGVSFDYFSLGAFDLRDDLGALKGQGSAFSFSTLMGYGLSLLAEDRLKLGVNGEFAMENGIGSGQTYFGGSLGIAWDFTRDISLGIGVMHLGSAGGYSPPSALNAGLSFRFADRKVLLALDGQVPFSADPLAKLGLEYQIGSTVVIRGGYRMALGAREGDVQSGPSAGLGFNFGLFQMDYAFVPYGSLSTAHRVSASMALPADFFKPKFIGAAATTVTAKNFFTKAQNYEKKGEVIQALLEYEKSIDAYPEKFRGKPINDFFKKAKERILVLKGELSKKGQSEQVRRRIKELTNEGSELAKRGEFQTAFARFNDALRLEDSPEIRKAMAEAKSLREEKKSGSRSEARSAFKSGRMDKAVEQWRRVLEIDPGDDEAQTFMQGHDSEIKDLLKKMHRKGIDLYVSGKVKEAIEQWRRGLSLDPSDPIKMRRDIEKAQKLLELRGQK